MKIFIFSLFILPCVLAIPQEEMESDQYAEVIDFAAQKVYEYFMSTGDKASWEIQKVVDASNQDRFFTVRFEVSDGHNDEICTAQVAQNNDKTYKLSKQVLCQDESIKKAPVKKMDIKTVSPEVRVHLKYALDEIHRRVKVDGVYYFTIFSCEEVSVQAMVGKRVMQFHDVVLRQSVCKIEEGLSKPKSLFECPVDDTYTKEMRITLISVSSTHGENPKYEVSF